MLGVSPNPFKATFKAISFQRPVLSDVLSTPQGQDVASFRHLSNPVQFGHSFPTQFSLNEGKWESAVADALIIPVYETEKPRFSLSGHLKRMNQKLGKTIAQVIRDEKFEGMTGEVRVFDTRPTDGIKAKKVILVGLGSQFDASPRQLEETIEDAFANGISNHVKSVAIALPEKTRYLSANTAIESIVNGIHRSTYQSAEAVKARLEIANVQILSDVHGNLPTERIFRKALKQGEAIANAISYSKDLANSPYNIMNVAALADKAKELASQHAELSVEIKDNAWIKKQMPAFHAVAKAGEKIDPPQFIKITYKPVSGKGEGDKPLKKIALVGKSIMYDTGGAQSKGDYMNGMSKDMTGGAYVLGIMQALATLKPKHFEVTGYLPAAPNLADARSYLPDDIINSAIGKKIEIRHTDAEGRLTLIDAVTQAAKDKPEEIITIATLTGAAEDAVGSHVALMAQEVDDAFQDLFYLTAKSQGEPFERMTVRDSDFDAISSEKDSAHLTNDPISDFRHAQAGAAFIMSGLPHDIPLLHLDLSGVMEDDRKMATGIGMKTLLHYLLNETKD